MSGCSGPISRDEKYTSCAKWRNASSLFPCALHSLPKLRDLQIQTGEDERRLTSRRCCAQQRTMWLAARSHSLDFAGHSNAPWTETPLLAAFAPIRAVLQPATSMPALRAHCCRQTLFGRTEETARRQESATPTQRCNVMSAPTRYVDNANTCGIQGNTYRKLKLPHDQEL